MKKFLKEVFTFFWIPLIIALVSYIFFQLHDVLLGISTLLMLSAIYTTIQLYLQHRKWWLGLIMLALALGYLAFFLLRAPTITLSINDQRVNDSTMTFSAGTVILNPPPQTNGEYAKNTVVTLTANPAAGADWKGWSGTNDNAANPTTVTMNRDKRVSVTFEGRYSLVINNQLVIGSLLSFNEGEVRVSPAPGGDGKYPSGTLVNLTAVSNSGYDWSSWVGTANDAANPTTVTTNRDQHISVIFEPRFSLNIGGQLVIGSSVNFDQGTVTVSPPPGDDSKYSEGTAVTLSAAPNAGYDWKSWAGTASDSSNPTSVTVSSDKFVSVIFNPRFALTVNNQTAAGPVVSVTGGTVALDPAPAKDGLYTKDSTVTLTAVPSSGYRFDHWSGAASGSGPSVTVSMSAARSVTATFIKIYSLTTLVSPSAGGSISPASGTFDDGTSVTLTATPAPGFRFDHWSGDANGNSASVSVTMNSNKNVTANFIKLYTLAVQVTPAAGGAVSPSSGTFDDGASVTLTATPAAGYRFVRWGGDATGTTASVTITMNGNKNITATFIKLYTLTTLVTPAGGGQVAPASGSFDDGASVTLTATPATGYRFDHWSGDATGTSATVAITMSSDRSVTATFIKTYQLTIVVAPAGSGTVSPASGTFDSGASVSLTATASAGFHFDHWSGDAIGTSATVSVTMNSDKTVTANFAPDTPPVTTMGNRTAALSPQIALKAIDVALPASPVDRRCRRTD
jgi:uncharacterized repeat protein (TIGR02543 family)